MPKPDRCDKNLFCNIGFWFFVNTFSQPENVVIAEWKWSSDTFIWFLDQLRSWGNENVLVSNWAPWMCTFALLNSASSLLFRILVLRAVRHSSVPCHSHLKANAMKCTHYSPRLCIFHSPPFLSAISALKHHLLHTSIPFHFTSVNKIILITEPSARPSFTLSFFPAETITRASFCLSFLLLITKNEPALKKRNKQKKCLVFLCVPSAFLPPETTQSFEAASTDDVTVKSITELWVSVDSSNRK